MWYSYPPARVRITVFNIYWLHQESSVLRAGQEDIYGPFIEATVYQLPNLSKNIYSALLILCQKNQDRLYIK